MHKKQAIALIFVSCFLAAAPLRAEAPLIKNGTWYISFAGISFAKVWVGLREPEQGRYSIEGTLKSLGLMRMFKVVKTSIKSEAALRDGQMRTQWFELLEDQKKSHIKLVYDDTGALIERIVNPEDGQDWRPRVAAEKVKNAYTWGDLFFALQAAQQRGDHLKGDGVLRFMLYDAKRLMELSFIYQNSSKDSTTDRFVLTRHFVDGYTPKEMKNWEKGEPPLEIFLRQSDGFAVRAELPLSYGTVVAKWKDG